MLDASQVLPVVEIMSLRPADEPLTFFKVRHQDPDIPAFSWELPRNVHEERPSPSSSARWHSRRMIRPPSSNVCLVITLDINGFRTYLWYYRLQPPNNGEDQKWHGRFVAAHLFSRVPIIEWGELLSKPKT